MSNAVVRGVIGAPYIFAETLYKANGTIGSVKTFRYHGPNETGKNQVKLTHLR